MSSSRRITRSVTARLTADTAVALQASPSTTATGSPPPQSTPPIATRKRKAADPPLAHLRTAQRDSHRFKRLRGEPRSPPTPLQDIPLDPSRKTASRAANAVMSNAGPTAGSSGEPSPQQSQHDQGRRRSNRRRSRETEHPTSSSAPLSSRRSHRGSRKDQDILTKDVAEKADDELEKRYSQGGESADTTARAPDDDGSSRSLVQDHLRSLERNDDPFAGGYLSRFAGGMGLSSSLRALTGIMSGTSSRLRNILEQLRVKEDPSVQLIALQELSELLLVSNEDNLAGHFAPEQFVKELVILMQPNELTGEENPEVMLLACRCIANMMEALPPATASVVYGGAVPILCQKLLEIHFIDLAEQALSTLEKISVEFPSSIVREGGLTACLTYLDFFATSTQRTAVTTAANCCRNIPVDSFPTVRDVMPILLNTLSSSDQRVVEQASLCVSRVVDSFKHYESKLEELISPELLQAVLRLLLPGSTNLIGPNIHTQFLRVLSISAHASPRLSADLLRMNVIDTLYQILTGVSPPPGTEDIVSKIDKTIIMQSIIRTPREQIFETLNVICELLPAVSQDSVKFLYDLENIDHGKTDRNPLPQHQDGTTTNEKRLELLRTCPDEVKRFAHILFPTLMHAYTSTVNLSVRQKVLTAQLRMLSNFDANVLGSALHGVAYASHLASIFSQQENPSLMTHALQAAQLLYHRLHQIYGPQFYREGVIAEISRLADRPLKTDIAEKAPRTSKEEEQFDQEAQVVSSKSNDPNSAQIADKEQGNRHPHIGVSETRNDHTLTQAYEKHHSVADKYGEAAVEVDEHIGKEEEIEQSGQDDVADEHDGTSIGKFNARASQHEQEDGEDGEDDENAEDDEDGEDEEDDGRDGDEDEDDGEDEEDVDDDNDDHHDPHSQAAGVILDEFKSFSSHTAQHNVDLQDIVTMRAKRFLDINHIEGDNSVRQDAAGVLVEIKALMLQLKSCYESLNFDQGRSLFQSLAKYFGRDPSSNITSYELLTSGIVEDLLNLFTLSNATAAASARADFLGKFMTPDRENTDRADIVAPVTTAFSVLIYKLQELLSRSEHFEVITVHHNAFESNLGSAASMLAKQLRLRLVADDESGIPKAYRNIMVSIHAIATFRALDDYLRPRIALSQRPRTARDRAEINSAMAAYATAIASHGERPAAVASALSELLDANPFPELHRATADAGEQSAHSRTGQRSASQIEQQAVGGASQSLTHATDLSQKPIANAGQSLSGPTDTLECADEAQIPDEEGGDSEGDVDVDVDVELNALVSNLVAESQKDTSSFGVDVSAPGGSLDKPERVAAAPSQSTETDLARILAIPKGSSDTSTSPNTSKPHTMSYASALQQVPEDWHIEFTINGQAMPSDTTIYRACHFNPCPGAEISSRNIWSATHAIRFRRVSGPLSANRSGLVRPALNEASALTHSNLPPSLDKHPVTSDILRLMSILHDLNANLEDVVSENKDCTGLISEPATQFVNSKLTAKLNRQLEEPLIVASQCLPSWSEDLARLYPFLFPFEARYLFLQSTSFGYSRLMNRWQSSQPENDSRHARYRDERPFLGRVQRQKVRISRTRILESAMKVMDLYGSSSSILEVEYFEEVGTGLGPTLEFYSSVSSELSKKKLKLWRENESFENDVFAFGKRGLFPAPMSEDMIRNENGQRVLHLFKMLGKFVARSMLDSRIIDISFNPTFFRLDDGGATVVPSLGAVATVDQDLANSLKLLSKCANARQRIAEDSTLSLAQRQAEISNIRINDVRVEELGLDFTLPGYPQIELQSGGADINVSVDNVDVYVRQVIDFTLGHGVQRQVNAFRDGFSEVFPYSALRAFTPDELVMLFGRVEEDWSLETLTDSVKADHGYNLDSQSVRNLLQVMSELSPQTRRDFLQFVTGSPKLPIGGFKSLTPMFTVVCKPSEPPYTSDDYLPSVMTCVNYLKMPNYSSMAILREKLVFAIKEGQGAFHLS